MQEVEASPAKDTPHRWLDEVAGIRLVAAWLITFGLLLYAWARVFVMGRMAGRPEALWLVGLAAGLAAVLLLTFRLWTSFQSRSFSRRVLL
jgi:hypothetical protein